jgi:hypothetical protein
VIRTRRWEHGRIDGEPIEHVREDLSSGAKRVWWERGGSKGLRGLRIVDLPLYKAASLNGAQDVILVEGEPATDAGDGLGVPVVGTVTGAKSAPSDESLRLLLGKTAYLWPDNDDDGERHMTKIAERLSFLGQPPEKIRRIVWNDAPAKGDLADWVAARGTPDHLTHLLADAPSWEADDSTTTVSSKEPPRAARLVVAALSDVVSQPVAWDWHRWLPRGKFHLLGGYAGDGKSTLLASLAATGSRGGEWPDGTYAPRVMRTLFLLGEDSAADTLRPRLELHDADMDQIFVFETVLDENGRERFFNIGKHLDLLEEEIVGRGIDWIVIDPLTTIMPGTDRNAEGDTRDALTPLIKLADRRNVTITGVAHVGKSGDARRAAQKILGATAFHALARVVWMVAPDEDERMVLGVAKSNLAMKPPSLVWTRDEDGPIQWEGVSGRDVEDLLSNAPKASPRADAEGFLREYLARGARSASEVQQAAKERGIADITLRRAADVIPAKKWKASGTHGLWYWSLPDSQPQHAEPPREPAQSNLLTPKDAQVSKLSNFAPDNLLNSAEGEHLHETEPISPNGQPTRSENVMEGAQLAHRRPLRGEQVISARDDSHLDDPWAHAASHRL